MREARSAGIVGCATRVRVTNLWPLHFRPNSSLDEGGGAPPPTPANRSICSMAPADAGNYAPPEEQVKNQTERLRSSTVGPSDDPNNPDELAHLIPAWESLPLDYRKKYTTDGKYGAPAFSSTDDRVN